MLDRPERQPDARLLRMLADDELDAAQRAALERELSADSETARRAEERVAFERRLRQAVGQALGDASAPSELRASIEQTLAQTPAATHVSSNGELDPVLARVAEGVRIGEPVTAESSNGQPAGAQPQADKSAWRRFFASPQHANIAAVAAVLALIAGAVLFGIFGRTIDDVPPPPQVRTADLVGNATEYIDREHTRCTTDFRHVQQHATYHSKREAEDGLSQWLGAPVHVYDLSALGYEFIGAGRCEMPLDQQPSGRLMYRKSTIGRPGPMVSVFMAPTRGPCRGMCSDLRPGEWSRASSRPSCKHRVLYTTDSRLVYFLTCCDDKDLDAVGRKIAADQQQPDSETP